MKMPFSRTHRRRNALLTPGMGLATAGVVVFAVVILILRTVFPGAIAFVADPLWRVGSGLAGAAGTTAGAGIDQATLAKERDQLLAENAALRQQNATLEARSSDLTRLLGTRTSAPEGILASVLARPPVSPYDLYVIDQGTNAGVRVGARVEGPGGAPVGTVEDAGPATARVLLYSATGRTTEGWAGETRMPITLEGAGAGSFRASLPRESAVAVGDQVYVSGDGALPIGTVVRLDTDPSSPRAIVHVRPLVNIFSLPYVTVAR